MREYQKQEPEVNGQPIERLFPKTAFEMQNAWERRWIVRCPNGHIVRVSARVQPTLGVDVHCLECDLQEGGDV